MKRTYRARPYPVPVSRAEEHKHCKQMNIPSYTTKFEYILPHGRFPRQKYIPRDKDTEIFSTLHRGQRKLLMSEIGALILLDPNTEYLAIYAGAAPGIHTPLLSELFPNVIFHLYDPAPFRIAQSDRIKLFNMCFTDDLANSYAALPDTKVFICDIRRTIEEKNVWEDMLAQRRWHEIMTPYLTSLKFRLPWPGNGLIEEGSTLIEYLDGDIYLPIWGPHNTTESRLVIQEGRHSGVRMYDCLTYEEEMCYFNRVVRPSINIWQRLRLDGLDGCYDCTAEVRLLEKYSKIWPHTNISTAKISRELKRGL